MIVVVMDREGLPSPQVVVYEYIFKFGISSDLYLRFGPGPNKNEDERVTGFCKGLVELGGLTIMGSDDKEGVSNKVAVALLSGHLEYRMIGDDIEILGDLGELEQRYQQNIVSLRRGVHEYRTIGYQVQKLSTLPMEERALWVQ